VSHLVTSDEGTLHTSIPAAERRDGCWDGSGGGGSEMSQDPRKRTSGTSKEEE
jgi:hypothetical protein